MTDLVVTAFPTNQDLDPAQLRQAFGIFPSGVVAVAAEVDGRLVGLAASSFTSVSLDPPLVSFSIANTSKTWPDLRRASHLGVTVLAHHHGLVALWDVATGRERALLRGHDGPVQSVVFSPDGRTLATGGNDGVIRLWDTGPGSEFVAEGPAGGSNPPASARQSTPR